MFSLQMSMNRHLRRLTGFIAGPKEPAAILGVAAYTIFIMFLVSVVNASNMSWGVFAGERLISVVADAAEGRAVIRQLIDENKGGSGNQQAQAVLERVYLKKTRLAGPVLSGDSLKLAISEAVTSRVKGTGVVVDGKTLLVMSSRKEAQQLLDELKAPYATPDGLTRFAEDIRLVDTLVEKSSIVGLDRALEMVKNGVQKKAGYRIKEGDTLWDIAASLGLSIDNLMALNPGLNPQRLRPGEMISLSRTEYLINVETVLTRVSTEVIEIPVEERKDPSLYLGERRVLAQGKTGKKEVTYQVTLRNGAEVDRKEIGEVVLDKPEPKIVATGTRILLASRGGGRLAWPTAAGGSVVSPYGARGDGMHTGIDIGAGHGSAVVAAESGTVTMAGWYGGYGKCVDISHGEGVVTRYAHLSNINVEVGQSVARGEFIGRVGATGYATGPHLHFEVIVNGRRVNPMNYL